MVVAAAKERGFRTVNQRALGRHQQLGQALVMVDEAIGEVEKLICLLVDYQDAFVCGYRIPDAEELARASKKAGGALRVMARASKRWEAELVAREWK